MAYASWPASLPDWFLGDGFSMGGSPPVKRQQMESGLDRVTLISSTTVRTNTYSIVVDDKQLAEFWSFYENEAMRGAAFVVMPMMTANKPLPHLARFTDYPTHQRHGIKWRVTVSLETTQQQFDWS